jgi:hypothetical protein
MLHSSTLTKRFGVEASAAAVYLHNRVPCMAMLSMTLFEGWNGTKPDVSHLHIFGCDPYFNIPNDERNSIQRYKNAIYFDIQKRKKAFYCSILQPEK